jgi:ubiquinone/menaquinone biosynthesis C-methylase UbiE
MADPDFTDNIARFTGFAGLYDAHRPSPPEILAELIRRYSGLQELGRVVDLGCGTGLSTRYWAAHARETVGIDPTTAMLDEAKRIGGDSIRYLKGFSHAMGLPDHEADVVSCSQSLHWMDPLPTFREAARILRPGGVFVAFDYDWPPATGFAQLDALYERCVAHSRRMEHRLHLDSGIQHWAKDEHLTRMQASGHFRYTREIAVHHMDQGTTDRLIGLLLSQGHVQTLLKNGVPENQLGIDGLRSAASRVLGSDRWPWVWTSRIRIGITG